MFFHESKIDIKDVAGKNAIVAHCIAADLGWGSGIAPVIIRDIYDAEKQCRYKCSNNPDGFTGNLVPGDILPITTERGTFVNLITKEHSWDKPTYSQLTKSLVAFKDWIVSSWTDIPREIIMPRIGCGLDRLDWDVVKYIIQGVFREFPVDIEIVYK